MHVRASNGLTAEGAQRARRVSAALTLGAIGLASAPALAQGSEGSSTAVLESAAASQASEQPEQAFAEAVQLFKAGRYADALPRFTSLATTTSSPNAWLYLGHSLLKLERFPEAHAAFSKTLTEIARRGGAKYETTRQAAAAQLDWLNQRVARLLVVIPDPPPELSIVLDGQPVDALAIATGVILSPGAHQLEASGEGVRSVKRRLDLQSGSSSKLTLSFTAIEAEPEPTPEKVPEPQPVQASAGGSSLFTMGLVAGGVAVAGFGVFTVLGLQAKSAYEGLSEDCGRGACAMGADPEKIDSGKQQQRLANVGLAVGLAGALASGTLLYLNFTRNQESNVSLELSPRQTRVAYTARF